jgi:hypothetical protein
MPEALLQLVIVLVVCGFFYWVWQLIAPKLPIAEPFLGWINIIFLILIGAIVIFYAVIPLLRMLPRLLH